MSVVYKGWDSQAIGEFPGKFESSNLSRRNLSRETGRTPNPHYKIPFFSDPTLGQSWKVLVHPSKYLSNIFV